MNIKSTAVKLGTLIVLSAALFSFSAGWGGDSFQIYLNKKLVLQHYVSGSAAVKSFQLAPSDYNSQIDVYYSHCGKVGSGRTITIKDAQNQVLKQWAFTDVTGNNIYMSCKAKDIVSLQKKNSASGLKLYYSSKELPKPRLLASIILAEDKLHAKAK